MARGKRYRQAYERIDRTRAYDPAEAVNLIKQTAAAKFDETVELHIRLGVNVRHAEEQLRGTLALPQGLGKNVTIAVFAEGDQARQATEAGADHVGSDDLAAKVEEGWTDFDVAIATPAMMPKVGKLGRVLGPQGKMPNPKVGTVTDDIAKAVDEAKAGKVEYRTDKQAIVHLSIGKTSFDESALLENYAAVIEEMIRAKPAAAKGRYLLSVTLTTTMGPGIRVDSAKTRPGEIMSGTGEFSSNGAGEVQAPPAEPKPAKEKEPAEAPAGEEQAPAGEEQAPAGEEEAPAAEEEASAEAPAAEQEPADAPGEEPATA
jgi:large subunit ribosomal protein L1